MNVKNTIFSACILGTAIAISGCGSSGGDDNTVAKTSDDDGSTSKLAGTWETCENRTLNTWEFTETHFRYTYGVYLSEDCSTGLINSLATTGKYTIGSSLTADGGETAFELDLDVEIVLDEVNVAQNPSYDQYSIFALAGDKLLLASSGEFSEEKRPTALSDLEFTRISSSATPITSPANAPDNSTTTPTDQTASDSVKSIAGIWDATFPVDYDGAEYTDEMYLIITEAGEYLEYDYLGDTYASTSGNYMNCYALTSQKITSLGGDRYELSRFGESAGFKLESNKLALTDLPGAFYTKANKTKAELDAEVCAENETKSNNLVGTWHACIEDVIDIWEFTDTHFRLSYEGYSEDGCSGELIVAGTLLTGKYTIGESITADGGEEAFEIYMDLETQYQNEDISQNPNYNWYSTFGFEGNQLLLADRALSIEERPTDLLTAHVRKSFSVNSPIISPKNAPDSTADSPLSRPSDGSIKGISGIWYTSKKIEHFSEDYFDESYLVISENGDFFEYDYLGDTYAIAFNNYMNCHLLKSQTIKNLDSGLFELSESKQSIGYSVKEDKLVVAGDLRLFYTKANKTQAELDAEVCAEQRLTQSRIERY